MLLSSADVSLCRTLDEEFVNVGEAGELGSYLEERQIVMGEGPVLDSSRDSIPVLVDDLSRQESLTLWPMFSHLAIERDIATAFCIPVRIGAANLGVLSAYRKSPGSLSPSEYSDALILASFAGAEIVRELAGASAESLDHMNPLTYDQSYVQLAAGMVAEQFDIGIVESLVRIRARAFSSDLPVTKIARLIVEGRLILER